MSQRIYETHLRLVFPSLHQNCRHEIIYTKFSLQIFYPPPYYLEIWHYANIHLIRKAILQFNWDKAF